MLLLKIVITVAAVTTLSIIAERVSPRAAGILSGYPLGSAISLFFIGLEQGADFAGASAPYTTAGLSAMLTFLFIYYRVSASIPSRKRYLVISGASLAALLAFFAISAALQGLHLPTWADFLIAAAAILGYGFLFRTIPNTQIVDKVRLGPAVLVFRASLAAMIIVLITGAAKLVPPSWAGLFSAFPSTIFPLLLIIHSTYGASQAHTIIKNVPTGLWALVFYTLCVSFVYPRFGIYWGTLISFGAATVYLLALALWNGHRTR